MAHGQAEAAHALLAEAAETIIGQAEDMAIMLYFEALTPA